jgi:hypothetical protein
MHLQNQLIIVVQSQGKFSTSSPTTALEMLAMEVTPRLQQEQSSMPIIFYVTIVLMGDPMGRDSGRYHSNSGTGSGMRGTEEVLI